MNIQRFGVRYLAIATIALYHINRTCDRQHWSPEERHGRFRIGSHCQQRRDIVAKRAAAKRRRQAIKRHRESIA